MSHPIRENIRSIPYLPNTKTDRKHMLREIGVSSVDDLFRDVPEQVLNVPLTLPQHLSELELKEEIRQLSQRNVSFDSHACFLGAGYYHHFIPSIVGHITGRSEFYTAYTPYQAEASQGTLQSIYEYQSLICQLTEMEVSNASMYDGSTSAMEAALLACRITGRNRIAILSTVNPWYQATMRTYIHSHNISLDKLEPSLDNLFPEHSCLVIQAPNFFGYFENVVKYAQKAHALGVLLIVIFDPISLGLFKPPGKYGADIAVAEGQSLGSPVSLGGPGLGIFACRKEYLRQIPGRIVGKTTDTEGRIGYVLTLATREQHIRRERATSNICTNQALVALAATAYLAALGKQGLRQIAELCYHKAHYAARAISELGGYSLAFQQPFFKEFVVQCPKPPEIINNMLLEKGIIGGLDISNVQDNCMLLCVTEMNSKQQIDRLIEVLKGVGK